MRIVSLGLASRLGLGSIVPTLLVCVLALCALVVMPLGSRIGGILGCLRRFDGLKFMRKLIFLLL